MRPVCLLSKLTYWSGLDALFYFLNRRAKRIVTFHNVIPKAMLAKGDEGLICFSDEKFNRIVNEVGSRFAFSNDMDDPKTCTLTFDDGYLNQLEVAGRILRAKGIPAILFLAQDLLDSRQPLAVDQCLVWAGNVPLKIAEQHWGRSFADRTDLWQSVVRPLFAADGQHRGRETLRQLDAVFPLAKCFEVYAQDYRRLRYSGVTKELVAEFEKHGWVFAYHTQSHFPVKELSAEDARMELMPPQGKRDVVFSFPYGDAGSVSERDIKLVEGLGYPCAVSNEVEKTALQGRYFLPRFMLTSDDRYLIHFQLSGMKYFLKYRQLLPRW